VLQDINFRDYVDNCTTLQALVAMEADLRER
jgi:hypothetical protein